MAPDIGTEPHTSVAWIVLAVIFVLVVVSYVVVGCVLTS